jgi:hypothetical protein
MYTKEMQLGKRKVPNKRQRTKISRQDYQKMIEEFGEHCNVCGSYPIEAHHIVFRSHFGSGNWRNLVPLCNKHHRLVHKNRVLSDYFRQQREERFGKHFWKDKYALFKEGLISNTTDEAFEKFLVEQEKRQ